MTEAGTDAPRWGFIGAGRMATALIRGMIRAGTADAGVDLASDPLEAARTALAAETGVAVVDSNVAGRAARATSWSWPSSRRACRRSWSSSGTS